MLPAHKTRGVWHHDGPCNAHHPLPHPLNPPNRLLLQEITEFLAGEELLRVKPFIGQGNSTGAKARAAAAEAAKLKAARRNGAGDGAGSAGGGGDDGDDLLTPKQRLKGQTQKEQKVGGLWARRP